MLNRFITYCTPFGLACAAAVGCGGGGNQNNSSVTGTVVYKGSPIKGGNMTFYHPDRGTYSSTIDTNGRFVLRDAPAGTLTVTIDTESINPDKDGVKGGGGQAAARRSMEDRDRDKRMAAEGVSPSGPKPASPEELRLKYTKIPAKYADKAKTDLKIEVAPGKNEVTLDLLE